MKDMTALPVHREKNTVPFFRFSVSAFLSPSGFLRVYHVPGILLRTLVLQWTTVSVTVPGSHPLGKTTNLCVCGAGRRGGGAGVRGAWLKQRNLFSLSSGSDVWDQGVGRAALPPPSEGSRLLPALVASGVSWLVDVVDGFLLPVLTWSSLCPNLLFP